MVPQIGLAMAPLVVKQGRRAQQRMARMHQAS
jgi:hypothetical protein